MENIYPGVKIEDNSLISSRLFGNEELRSIIMMRKQYETKIRRKEKPAFFAYIDKEKKILSKIRSMQSKNDEDLSKQIILRILRIHKIALSFFKDDLKFWTSYIKFCMDVGNIELVTEAFPLMLQVHTEKRLWHTAAKWELSQFNNADKALNYLYRGLHFHPSATCLYMQIYKIELDLAYKYESEENKNLSKIDKEKLAEKKALNVFDMATKVISDIDFYTELLRLADEVKYSKNLQAKISIFLSNKFLDNVTNWNLLAQRELEGHYINDENNYEFIEDLDVRVKNCIKKYQKAIELIPTEEMWEKYLNALVDLYETSKTNANIKDIFKSACNIAHKKGYMTEKQYTVWLECIKTDPNIQDILENATKNKPHFSQLWSLRIRHHFVKKEESVIENIFTEAIKALGDKSIHIWRRKLQFYQLKGDNLNKIDSIFREGLEHSVAISLALQPQYLDWVALFRSRDVLHQLYKELSKREPICIDLHKKMAELEAMCSQPNEEIFVAINKIMDEHPDEIEEWKDYLCREIHYGPSWRKLIYQKYLSLI